MITTTDNVRDIDPDSVDNDGNCSDQDDDQDHPIIIIDDKFYTTITKISNTVIESHNTCTTNDELCTTTDFGAPYDLVRVCEYDTVPVTFIPKKKRSFQATILDNNNDVGIDYISPLLSNKFCGLLFCYKTDDNTSPNIPSSS